MTTLALKHRKLKHYKKPLRRALTAVLQNNNFNFSVCIANIDIDVLSYAILKKGIVSWKEKEMLLFVPKQITFSIPYTEIEGFSEFPGRKQMEIRLRVFWWPSGFLIRLGLVLRNLVSKYPIIRMANELR
jgi:hypothetical protein